MDEKIYITSCETYDGAWRVNERILKKLYERSNKKYTLTDDPDAAKIILIGNCREQENWGEKILKNEWIAKYPDKCFSLSEQDEPLFINQGIYASGKKSIFTKGRIRSGSYTLYPEKFNNAFVQSHIFSENDFDEKKYLFSFIGRDSAWIRHIIFGLQFERKDILIEDATSTFDLWMQENSSQKTDRQKYYFEVLEGSKFALCPRGSGASTLRLFEAMKLGIAPIIVSDDWIFPKGPNWSEFSITIKEKNIGELEKIVGSYEDNFRQMGLAARKAYLDYFAEPVYFNYLIDNCLDIQKHQIIPERFYWKSRHLIIKIHKLGIKISEMREKIRLRTRIKNAIRSFHMKRDLI